MMKRAEVTGKVHTGAILVDGLGVGDVGNIVLRDRQHLAEDGIMIVVLTLEKYSNQLLAGPDIVSRGFVYVRESEDLMGQAKSVVEDAIDILPGSKNITDWGKIKGVIKDSLGDFLWKTNQEKTDDSANYNGGVRYMNKIQECVEKLLEVIREDSAYQRYLACEEMLKSNPELKKQIDEFRVAVFHMNNNDTQGDLYDITDEVENRYEKLRKVPEVNAYLEAELDVCRMLQQVQEQFRNGIDLNIPNV